MRRGNLGRWVPMRQQAEVIAKRDAAVVVRLRNPGRACGNCSGCIRLTGEERPETQDLELVNTVAADIGDIVIVESTTKLLIKAVCILYGVPLLGLIAGYLVGLFITDDDSIAGLYSLSGLLLSVLVARLLARAVSQQETTPRIVARSCR